jgi:hypothetical protein
LELVEVDPIELCLLRHFRTLKQHGWGEFHMSMENHLVTSAWAKLSDDPKKLREIQQQKMNISVAATKEPGALSAVTK